MFVAIKERSAGNDTVGDMWLETGLFADDTPISKVFEWGNQQSCAGKLIITRPQNSELVESAACQN